MAVLVIQSPEGTERIVELRAHNTIGRHPNNSIQVLDKIVSKEHCTVTRRDDGYLFVDLGSLNGSYINGNRVSGTHSLRAADELVIGSTKLTYYDTPPSMHHTGNVRNSIADNAAKERNSLPTGAFPHSTGSQSAGSPGAISHGAVSQPGPSGRTKPGGVGSLQSSAGSTAEPTSQIDRALLSPLAPAPSPPDTAAHSLGSRSSGSMSAVMQASASSPFGSSAARNFRNQTNVMVTEARRAIGTQIQADYKGFLPYEQLASNQAQLSADYERLRFSHELIREIGLERDLNSMLNKILLAVFRFVRADRGVIFLREPDGSLNPGASLRRDGSETAITVSSTIMDHVIRERATVLTHDAAMDFAGSKGKSMILNRISSAIVAPLVHGDQILGVLWLDSETLAQFQPRDLEMVTSVSAQAAMFIEINTLGRKVEQEIITRERFSRLLSPNVAEKVVSGEMVIQKGGQQVPECTVFNSDIRGFTTMSEGAEPAHIVDMLNEYFELMVEVLFKHEGTLDKFMGDGIMALWGAPVAHANDAERAVECALEQMAVLAEFNAERVQRGLVTIDIGIGIHTGPVVAGYIGSSRSLSYTVIGDTANTSARLCGIAAPGQVLISETTRAQLNGHFLTQELPPAQLKGKEKPFPVFAVIGRTPQNTIPDR